MACFTACYILACFTAQPVLQPVTSRPVLQPVTILYVLHSVTSLFYSLLHSYLLYGLLHPSLFCSLLHPCLFYTKVLITHSQGEIIIFLKRNILFLETILIARAHTHTHTHTPRGTCTHKYSDNTKLNTQLKTGSKHPGDLEWIKMHGTENMAGLQFWEKKCFHIRSEWVQRGFLSERKDDRPCQGVGM